MLLTVKEAAKELRCSQNTVRLMCRENKIPNIRCGKRYRIDLDRAWNVIPEKEEINEDYLTALAALRTMERR